MNTKQFIALMPKFKVPLASEINPKLRQCRDLNTSSATLTALAADEHRYIRHLVARHPNTPPLVKLWLKDGYGEMTLEDFLRAVDSKG